MVNLNWGTRAKHVREQGNIKHFRDQKTENKVGSNLGNKGTSFPSSSHPFFPPLGGYGKSKMKHEIFVVHLLTEFIVSFDKKYTV